MERAAAAGTAPRRCAAKVARARVPAPPPAGVVRRRRRVERRGPSRRPNHQVRRTFLCPSRRFRRRHRPGSTVESVPLEPPVLFVFFVVSLSPKFSVVPSSSSCLTGLYLLVRMATRFAACSRYFLAD